MTNQTKQFILTVCAFTFSLGFLGYLMVKIGILDIVITLLVNFAFIFPIMMVTFGLLNPDTYDMMADEVNSFVDHVMNKMHRGEEPVLEAEETQS